jgi:hypothetical protein
MGAKRGRDPLLIEVLAELGRGRISEDYVRSRGQHGYVVRGVTASSGHVVVNPAPEVVEVLLHEFIHRIRPGWSERTVQGRAVRLRRLLSDREIQAVYDYYQRVAVKVKRRGRTSA